MKSCPSGCRPLQKHGLGLEATTCPCGFGYFEENGAWISGDRVRNKQARTREEYYASRGRVAPTISRSQHSKACSCCTAPPTSTGKHKEQSTHLPRSSLSDPYAGSLQNAFYADSSSSSPRHNQYSTSPSSYSSMTSPYSSSCTKTHSSYMPPLTGLASTSSNSPVRHVISSAHGRGPSSGSGSLPSTEYSTTSPYQSLSSGSTQRRESSSQSSSSSVERDRPTDPGRGFEKEKGKGKSVATSHKPADFWTWSSEHQRYYHAERDPATGETRNNITSSLD